MAHVHHDIGGKEGTGLSSFKDYPEEEYDKKEPWYVWLKEQIARKDAWKRRIEEKIRKLFETRPKPNHSIKDLQKRLEDHSFNVAEWFEKAEKDIFGEEAKK